MPSICLPSVNMWSSRFSHHQQSAYDMLQAIQSIGVSVNMQTSLNDYLMYSVSSEVLIVSV
jgi:hypothetical protein